MNRSAGPLDDVLGRWLDRDISRGRAPFDARAVVRALGAQRQCDLVLEVSDALEALRERTRISGSIGWRLDPAANGEILAYIPAGARLERRVTHGGLYADRLFVEPPQVPHFTIGYVSVSLLDLLREYRSESTATEPPTPISLPESNSVRSDSDFDEFLDLLDELDEADEREKERLRPTVFAQVPTAAEMLLQYAWMAQRPVAEGWLSIIDTGWLVSDNIKQLRRDPDVRAAIERWLPDEQGERNSAFGQLFTGAGLADYAHAPHVLTLPSTRAARDLIELANRYYIDIPYGGAMFDSGYPPPRRAVTSAGTELQRGSWFDELLVGLGPVMQHLDTDAVCELRASGVAASLKHWMEQDLNRLAFATAQGDDLDRLLAECTRKLNAVADATVSVVGKSRSATLQSRLKQAGIWGTSGMASGFVGTIVTGSSLDVAAAVAGIGFALSGAAGAIAGSDVSPAVSAPVLLDILATTRRGRQRRSRLRFGGKGGRA